MFNKIDEKCLIDRAIEIQLFYKMDEKYLLIDRAFEILYVNIKKTCCGESSVYSEYS